MYSPKSLCFPGNIFQLLFLIDLLQAYQYNLSFSGEILQAFRKSGFGKDVIITGIISVCKNRSIVV